MAETARWNDHIFEVSPNLMRGFSDLSITGSATTEEKETGSQKYVSYKNGGTTQVTLTAILSVFTGSDVREEAMAFVDEARRGCYGYLYVDSKKLVACPLMLTNAAISKTEIAAGGTWTYAEAKLTFKQCGKYDGETSGSSSSSGSGSASKSGSVKSSTGTTTKDWRETFTSRLRKGAAADAGLINYGKTSSVKTATTKTTEETKSAQSYINNYVTRSAQTQSSKQTASNAKNAKGGKITLYTKE
jgi:hypothetical protein